MYFLVWYTAGYDGRDGYHEEKIHGFMCEKHEDVNLAFKVNNCRSMIFYQKKKLDQNQKDDHELNTRIIDYAKQCGIYEDEVKVEDVQVEMQNEE